MVLFKTNYNCSSQSSELPEDEQLSCGTTVPCVRRKWFMAHWNHWIKSGRVCLDFLLYDVYLLGKGCLVLTWVMTFHIVKTKLSNLYCLLSSCIFKLLNFLIILFLVVGFLFHVSVFIMGLSIDPSGLTEYRKSNWSTETLCRPGWLWSHRDLPVSAFRVLGFKVCTTTFGYSTRTPSEEGVVSVSIL